MSKTLEKALARAKREADKAAGIERHERMVALSLQQTKLLRAKEYGDAEEVNIEINAMLQAVRGEASADE